MAPQVSSGWWHNYRTITRQEGWANEQSMYSLMSMIEGNDHKNFTSSFGKIPANDYLVEYQVTLVIILDRTGPWASNYQSGENWEGRLDAEECHFGPDDEERHGSRETSRQPGANVKKHYFSSSLEYIVRKIRWQTVEASLVFATLRLKPTRVEHLTSFHSKGKLLTYPICVAPSKVAKAISVVTDAVIIALKLHQWKHGLMLQLICWYLSVSSLFNLAYCLWGAGAYPYSKAP